ELLVDREREPGGGELRHDDRPQGPHREAEELRKDRDPQVARRDLPAAVAPERRVLRVPAVDPPPRAVGGHGRRAAGGRGGRRPDGGRGPGRGGRGGRGGRRAGGVVCGLLTLVGGGARGRGHGGSFSRSRSVPRTLGTPCFPRARPSLSPCEVFRTRAAVPL